MQLSGKRMEFSEVLERAILDFEEVRLLAFVQFRACIILGWTWDSLLESMDC